VRRQRGAELDQTVIQKRGARLERNRHRHAVDLDHDIVGQIGDDVDVLLLVQGRRRIAPGKSLADKAVGVVGRELTAQSFTVEQPLLGLLEKDHPAHMLKIGGKTAALDETPRLVDETLFLLGRRQQGDQGLDRSLAQPAGQPGIAARGPFGDVGLVAAQQLVAAVAREHHSDVLARHLRDHPGRKDGKIPERLVELADDPFGQPHGIRGDDLLMMFGAEMACHQPGPGQLVVGGVVKTDRIALDPRCGGLTHHRHHGA